jgi:2-methylcitrate dehydratase
MDRPFGHSRISRSLMSLVDAGFRTVVRMEASAEFYSVPKLWFIGANRDAFSSNTWTSLIQAINAITADENGELPQLHQVQQASMTPHSDMLKTLAMLVASQTRVPVDYLGITLDNPTSAEAMASAERRLTRIADKQNVAFGRELKRAMGIAVALREGANTIPDSMRDVHPVWAPTREISDAARADAFTKIADKITGYADSDVGLERLGLTREEILNAVSLAWVDGQSLRTYRHAPNTGTRKSWAAGDATSRAVRLALMAKTGEMGYPSALTAPVWGFYDVSFKGESFRFQRPYGSYVMENVLFKISFPAEFHSQTAVEAAMTLYEQMQAAGKTAADIEKVTIRTHEACIRIIDKKGPLNNPADRDHCIQYMVAIPLLFGRLTAADYEDNVAQDKRIDALREKINCFEDPAFTADYHDPEKRAIANAITLEFTDGTRFEEVVVEYPIGHARRRQDGIPKLVDKFKINLARQFPTRQQQRILEVSLDRTRLEQMPVNEYLDLYVI